MHASLTHGQSIHLDDDVSANRYPTPFALNKLFLKSHVSILDGDVDLLRRARKRLRCHHPHVE